MLKKFTVCVKNLVTMLIEKLEHITPGYLAHCQDCGYIGRLSYLKDAQRFMCYDCMVRYAKLYVKMNKL